MLTLTFASESERCRVATERQVNVWHDERGEVCARAFAEDGLCRIEWSGLGSFVFSRHAHDVRVTPATGVTREVIADTFDRLVQPVILQALGWQALHASAVLGPSGVWAFCARSGAGKSTIAFGLQYRGLAQFSDDALVLRLNGHDVTAHALPFASRLRPESREYFAQAPIQALPGPVAVGTTAPLDVVFLLSKNEDEESPTKITALPASRAFSAVLTHAHCYDADNQAATKQLIADYIAICEHVPVFVCRYRPGLRFLSGVIDALVQAATNARKRTSDSISPTRSGCRSNAY